MANEIKVSILCLAYNHGKYIRKTLEGFVSQKTDFEYEVIVHDDASTDDTARIIREYAEKYSFIRPIYQTKNQYSQNVSILPTFMNSLVRGTYIAFCEGDDYWTDVTKLQKQVDYMDANPDCSMCCHAYEKIRASDEVVLEIVNTLVGEQDLTPEQAILYHNPSQIATQMFRTEVVTQMPELFYGTDVGDYPLMLRAVSCGRIHYLPDNMAAYRVAAAGSWTERVYRDDNKQRHHWDLMIGLLQRFDEHSNYRFHSAVEKRLDEINFHYALIDGDYKAMKRCHAFHNLPAYRKGIICVGCFAPGLAKGIDHLINKLKGRD